MSMAVWAVWQFVFSLGMTQTVATEGAAVAAAVAALATVAAAARTTARRLLQTAEIRFLLFPHSRDFLKPVCST